MVIPDVTVDIDHLGERLKDVAGHPNGNFFPICTWQRELQ